MALEDCTTEEASSARERVHVIVTGNCNGNVRGRKFQRLICDFGNVQKPGSLASCTKDAHRRCHTGCGKALPWLLVDRGDGGENVFCLRYQLDEAHERVCRRRRRICIGHCESSAKIYSPQMSCSTNHSFRDMTETRLGFI